MLTLTLLSLVVSQSSVARQINDPTDVRSVARGVDAVSLDPAAAGIASGFELQVRTRLQEDLRDRWAVFATLPWSFGGLAAGYEWLELDGRRVDVGSLVLSSAISRRLSLGVAYRHLAGLGDSEGTWDFGVLVEPIRFLSLSAGVDQVNEPRLGNVRLERAWRAGAGVRPWNGEAWLTLGAETRIEIDGELDLLQTRFALNLAPPMLTGLHLRASYVPGTEELWAGLSVALGGVELRGVANATGVYEDDTRSATALALTLRTRPTDTLIPPADRTIEVVLDGDLDVPGDGLFDPGPSVSPIVFLLDKLADDPSVSRVIVMIGSLDVGMATVEELRGAIARLRQNGKEVRAELTGSGEKEFLVAAAADRIALDPGVSLVLDGFSATLIYLADALAKIGVRFDAVEVGRYKTAPDSLTRTSSRPEEVEVVGQLLGQSQRTLLQGLLQDRKLPLEQAMQVLKQGLVTPKEAVALKLVDELTQPEDAKSRPRLRERGESLFAPGFPDERWGVRPTVKVVPVVGNIASQGGATLLGPAAGAQAVIEELDDARRDGNVVAVVLRIDSPGGEVYASELIWRAVRLLAEEKPVVVSMGDVAASGGYYIAAPAHLIVAEPSTVTGSIGIFTLKPDVSGLLGMLSVKTETYKIGEHADWSSSLRGFTDEERAQVKRGLEVHYEAFLDRVATGRNLPIERVREIAQGRVYTGTEALHLGLVDGIGSLADAIREAKSRAGFGPDDRVTVSIPNKTLSLSGALTSMVLGQVSPVQAFMEAVREVEALRGVALARMPFLVKQD